jgi:putative PEP-CTERM system histidine kinase
MGLLALLLVGALPLIDALFGQHEASLWSTGTAIRLGFAVGNILLLENLYFSIPGDARWHINLLCVALAGLSLYDLVLYADAALFHRVSPILFAGRASAAALAVPLIAVGAARNRRWSIDIHVSRDVVFHTATLAGSGIFLLGLAATGEIFRRGGAQWGYVAEASLIFAGVLTIAVLLTSGSARSRIRSVLVEHFFSHRYDYRREWMRCIDMLTAPAGHVGLPVRAIRAVAEVVDSPAGALFLRAPEEAAFQWAGSWNMPAATQPIPPGHGLIEQFRAGGWIVELDDAAPVPEWAGELVRAWLAVPLPHQGGMIGFVVLARSRAPFRLDREVFDLLRVIGREVASRVAEQLAAQVLSQTQRLREYSQRFAFVIHDIKNVSGQLSMLLTNAEVHADNPEFQRDMLATIRASLGKITRLLARLQADRQERSHALIQPLQRLRDIVSARRRIAGAAIELTADDGAPRRRDRSGFVRRRGAAPARQCDRGERRRRPGPRRAAPRGSQRGGGRHRRGAGNGARVRSRSAVPAVRDHERWRARHRRLSGARIVAQGGRRPAGAKSQAGRHHDADPAAVGASRCGRRRGSVGLTVPWRRNRSCWWSRTTRACGRSIAGRFLPST